MLPRTTPLALRCLASCVLATALAGPAIAAAPGGPGDASPTDDCTGFWVVQGTDRVQPTGGELRIQRRPFVLVVAAAGDHLSLHAAGTPALVQGLRAAASPQLWLQAGDVLAQTPGRLDLADSFMLLGNQAGESAFAAAFGARNLSWLGAGASTQATPPLAGQVARNTGFVAATEFGGPPRVHVLPVVRTIGDEPITQTTLPALHLVLFTSLQSFPTKWVSMFQRATWSACTIRFGTAGG